MRVKINKLDKVFSDLIRESYEWTCVVCGTYYPEASRYRLQLSHIWSRRHVATRWDPVNGVAKCYSCHHRLGANPILFAEWAQDWLGPEEYEKLRGRAHILVKLTPKERELIYKHYQSEQKRVLAERKNGKTGWVPVEPWYQALDVGNPRLGGQDE